MHSIKSEIPEETFVNSVKPIWIIEDKLFAVHKKYPCNF